ncbi:hypothetical protein CY34DRAFT_18945 [Suillus luteus UH-Slu-Lm8-n1]|uniref:ABC1 atypical kinase-like domain-containing protein n=1 Tax=Suillus luteus UH-Slu-Lm8-n1 TaxID=930992 RepID=A0A0D0AED2_9AGAM|nr:hypothetical protein CY34DRAFT_18945 [Suillus luteus UH-Slu-Lm8-n1]
MQVSSSGIGDRIVLVQMHGSKSHGCGPVAQSVFLALVLGAVIGALPQEERNEIASRTIELCLRELFQFRLVQTDCNFTNFLWDSRAQQLFLADFGVTREYTKEFMDSWLRLLQATASEDRIACAEWSQKLGYLTGKENELMLNSHVDSMILLATPFKLTTTQPFAFGFGTLWADIIAQIRDNIPLILKHRLTPPPRETTV